MSEANSRRDELTRREFVATTVAAGAALAAASPAGACCDLFEAQDGGATPGGAAAAGGPSLGSIQVNGKSYALGDDPRVTLLDALRESCGLTGTKKGCDHGQCGACTVLVDGQRVLSCLVLACSAAGSSVTTIEGLASGDSLHPLQAAFIKYDAFQCGYCTPGQICSAAGLLAEGRAKSDEEVREQMSGNLCRCGAYVNIVAAIQEARAAKA